MGCPWAQHGGCTRHFRQVGGSNRNWSSWVLKCWQCRRKAARVGQSLHEERTSDDRRQPEEMTVPGEKVVGVNPEDREACVR